VKISDKQLSAIYADFGEPSGAWGDSLCLESLLSDAHEHGVLQAVWTYPLLDGRDVDLFLVSVELGPNVFAHGMPVNWYEIRPALDAQGAKAVRHVLERVGAVADEVAATFRRAAQLAAMAE
jgi:hypothetical protein